MVEHRPFLTFLSHAVLILGVAIVAFPLYVTFVASTRTVEEILAAPMPLTPGSHFVDNYLAALAHGAGESTAGVGRMMVNSLISALVISTGKIAISLLSAFAIVYFRFPLRTFFFWMIFVTLMLPVEVRILPTYQVVADLGMLDSYAGLTIPLIASATATFLFRQFFLTIPDELAEAARIDGAGPIRFLVDVVVPMSRSLGSSSLTTRSPMTISPAVMDSSPATIRSSVDLPQPEGPTMTMNSPSSTSVLTPWITSRFP